MNRILTTLALIALPGLAAAQGLPGEHFIQNWDYDTDGQVTFAEVEERRGDIFYMFDQNDDGLLQSEEYDLFDEARATDMENMGGHEGNAMRPVDQGMMRANNDANGDGLVSREEFVRFSATWFANMDRNGDGVITTDDFGRGHGNGNGQGNGNG